MCISTFFSGALLVIIVSRNLDVGLGLRMSEECAWSFTRLLGTSLKSNSPDCVDDLLFQVIITNLQMEKCH